MYREPTVMGWKLGLEWFGPEERNDQQEQNEETRIRKNEERLRNLQDILKRSNIQIIGVPEGEEEEQNLKTYLNK